MVGMIVQGGMLAARMLGPKLAQYAPQASEWVAARFGPKVATWMGTAATHVAAHPNLTHFAASTLVAKAQGNGWMDSFQTAGTLSSIGWVGGLGTGALMKLFGGSTIKQMSTSLAVVPR